MRIVDVGERSALLLLDAYACTTRMPTSASLRG
jgi:hypothetical protein